ncbi:MAG: thiamine pyrophosphokinase [Treponema sp.]
MDNHTDSARRSQNARNLQNDCTSGFHALIFTGGLFPPPEDTQNYWAQNGRPDFVIAADSGLEACDAYNSFYMNDFHFAPDRIVGDFDSLRFPSLIEKYGLEPETFPRDKDFTDTELAVDAAYTEAAAHGAENPRITLLGGDGGRIDHLLNIYDSFAGSRPLSVWLAKEQAVYLLKAGFRAEIAALTPDDAVSVSRTSHSRKGGSLQSEGLEWESPLFRKNGMPSLSNRISKDFFAAGKPVTLRADGADFLVIAPYSALVTIFPEK